MIARVKVPKYQVFDCFHRYNSKLSVAEKNAKFLHKEAPETAFLEQVKTFKTMHAERMTARGWPDIKLYPPGNIVHLTGGDGDAHYIPRWADVNDFREIQIFR